MKSHPRVLTTALLLFSCVLRASAQVDESPNIAGTPPKMLLLVRQQFKSGKAAERRKLEVAVARACDQLVVPNFWIDLESISGSPEALFFDPLDSFEQLDNAFVEWSRILASRPDIARAQEEIQAVVSTERTIIVVRRDDLGYRPQSIDLSKARFMRVLEVRLNPGHESEFVEAFRILAHAYETIKADTPWVVYQVNVGMPSPSFFVFLPMRAIRQNDDLLDWHRSLKEAQGEEATRRTDQIARDAYLSAESNLYVLSPEMSHVAKEFAVGDPQFWSPKSPAAAIPAKPKERGSTKKQ
jgi:hypothetical protein